MIDVELPVVIERQPDYTTCGPTSLHAIYHYWGDPIELKTVIAETEKLPTGGTLGVHLAVHALRRGYEVDTWVCNVRHFDPTWFQQPTDLLAKLRARFAAKRCLLRDGPVRWRACFASTAGSSRAGASTRSGCRRAVRCCTGSRRSGSNTGGTSRAQSA